MDYSSPDHKDDQAVALPSLFDTIQARFGPLIPVAALNNSTLLGISRSLEKTILANATPLTFLVNYQRVRYWERDLPHYHQAFDLLDTIVVFADFPPNIGNSPFHTPETNNTIGSTKLDKAVLIPLPENCPLLCDWFMVVLTHEFSLLLCAKKSSEAFLPETRDDLDVLIIFDPTMVDYALDKLEEAVNRQQPASLERIQAARKRFPTVAPTPRYISVITTQFIEEVNYYQRAARELSQEQAMRATIARLLHDASQPVTTLVSLLDFAQRLKQILPEEIDILLSSSNQLKDILDQLREVNHYRTTKVEGSDGRDYLDTGESFY